jgi:uncharacterized membrane protein (DUF4010 family)
MHLNLEIVVKIIYALGIGVLIGLERSLIFETVKSDQTELPDALLGVRTFSILSLGGFSAALIGTSSPMAAAVIVAGLVILLIAMYFRTDNKDPGITTEIAAVVCCSLGMLCYSYPNAAGAIALIITMLLASKRFMATTIKRLKWVELTDTLKLLVIIIIVLPLLPNHALDPYGAFNPYKVMFLVILISSISFVGYFLTKFLGPERGLGLTGIFGGLASSTAVTAAMANQAKQSPGLTNACAFAAIIANATMFCRVLVVVAILDRDLMIQLARSIGAMILVALASVAVLWLRSKKDQPNLKRDSSSELSLKNPFSIGPALKFAAFFVGILFVAKIFKIYLGDHGIYLASLVSGLADVDPITLSIAEQTKALQLNLTVGAIGITIAVTANSLVKSGIALYSGGLAFAARLAPILIGATFAGLAVLLIF